MNNLHVFFTIQTLGPLLFLPVVIVAAVVEGVALAWRGPGYDWRAALASLADALGREYLVHRYLGYSIAVPVIFFAWTHRLTTLPLSGPVAIGVLFLGQEFCYYWFHRASHRIRWFWATHAIHHSSNELNLSAAFRFGWFDRIAGGGIFYAPLVWLGFPPIAVFAVLTLNLLYQFPLHATWIPKLGWLEYVLNTPSHHRVHHAANLAYLDANYGGVLIIFDRLFGTFVAERDDLPCRYGLVKPLRTRNPFVFNFFEWRALLRDLVGARSWRDRAFFLFGPPGWRPDGMGATTEDLRRVAAAAE
ncbi:MAG TPA: sterol desaturase family protein [Stellaceae bacterium]|nr:sterol desaturase family protein [Stellaceae bacterium]